MRRHWCEEEVCRCVWGPIKSQCATAGPCCFSAGPAATLRRTFPPVSNVWAAEGRDMWPRAVGRLVTLLGGSFSSWIRHSMPIESIRWHWSNRSLFLRANIRWFQKKQKSLTLHNSVIKICHSSNHTTTEISVFSCCYYYRNHWGCFFSRYQFWLRFQNATFYDARCFKNSSEWQNKLKLQRNTFVFHFSVDSNHIIDCYHQCRSSYFTLIYVELISVAQWVPPPAADFMSMF